MLARYVKPYVKRNKTDAADAEAICEAVTRQIADADRRILAWHRSNALSRKLAAIPGVGPLIASALVAAVPNPRLTCSP